MPKACSSNWLERRTPNPDVGGSSPSRPASKGSGQLSVVSGQQCYFHPNIRKGMGNTCSPFFEGGEQVVSIGIGTTAERGECPPLRAKHVGGSSPSRPAMKNGGQLLVVGGQLEAE